MFFNWTKLFKQMEIQDISIADMKKFGIASITFVRMKNHKGISLKFLDIFSRVLNTPQTDLYEMKYNDKQLEARLSDVKETLRDKRIKKKNKK